MRQRLVERMAPDVRQQHRDHPGLADLGLSSHRETAVAESVVAHALVEYYNRAHLDGSGRQALVRTPQGP
ncbi:hypothetical protein ACJBCE_00380 [Streptomyces sp. NBUL23]|uniref:hypothetical protein n=1 Tax=Streptomyces sp. NBUL23 TaxID=3381354 RepID=UPI0038712253